LQFFQSVVDSDVMKWGLTEHKLGLVELLLGKDVMTLSEFGEFVFMVFGRFLTFWF
jgi:hypothetical protein